MPELFPHTINSVLPPVTHIMSIWSDLAGGGFAYLKNLALAQKTMGMDVEVIVLLYGAAEDVREDIASWRKSGIRVSLYDVHQSGATDLLGVVKFLQRCLEDRRDRIVHHADGGFPGIVGAAISGNEKTVITLHHTLPKAYTDYSLRLRKYLDPLVARYITVSESVNEYLLDAVNIAAGKTCYIPNGIDFSYPLLRREDLRARYGVDGSCFAVGFVGRLEAEKNVMLLLEAAGDLPAILFIIVGDGLERERLEEYRNRKSMDNVLFLGRINQAARMMPMFDLLCLPSATEACPVTVIEALYAGLPVLANDIGEVSRMLGRGRYGICRKIEQSGVIREGIEEICNNYEKYATMAKQGRKFVMREYSVATMAERTAEVYQAVQEASRRKGKAKSGRVLFGPTFRVLSHALLTTGINPAKTPFQFFKAWIIQRFMWLRLGIWLFGRRLMSR